MKKLCRATVLSGAIACMLSVGQLYAQSGIFDRTGIIPGHGGMSGAPAGLPGPVFAPDGDQEPDLPPGGTGRGPEGRPGRGRGLPPAEQGEEPRQDREKTPH